MKYTLSCLFLLVSTLVFLPSMVLSEEITLNSVGFRGGFNSNIIRIPPGEKEDFTQFDIFAQVGLPGGSTYDSGWEIRWRVNGSLGFLRGAGDTGFISTVVPGIIFRKPEWRLTIDGGPGVAFVSREHYGSQDLGGPIQIVGEGGVTFDVTDRIGLGWRFHHISDAGIWGSKNRGVDLNLFEIRYKFDSFPLYIY